MEYNIDAFTNRIIEVLGENVPNEPLELSKSKHPNRNGLRLKDLFSVGSSQYSIAIIQNTDTRIFEIGSPMAEAKLPHYHILQNSEVIRKRDRGTKTTKGSQSEQNNRLQRDYEEVKWNGKTYSKEYSKNVRGSRSKAAKILEPKLRYTGGKYIEDRRGIDNSYVNVHYRYIDRILDATIPFIAEEFGLRAKRKVDTGLQEEYAYQQSLDLEERFPTNILDIFDSFSEE